MMNDGPVFGVNQGDDNRLGVLDRLIAGLKVPALNVLEIGSYEGRSALAFSASIGRHCEYGGSVTCVDPWIPYLPTDDISSNETCQRMEDDLRNGAVFDRFITNIKHTHKHVPIYFHVGTLSSFVLSASAAGARFGMVYIDGSHIYEDVSADINNAKALVETGGIICGDDLERQLNTCDPELVRQIRHREYVDNFHPGVTLAVWEAFGKVWSDNGVWAMQKCDRGGEKWSFP